jgi:hypothetical protein
MIGISAIDLDSFLMFIIDDSIFDAIFDAILELLS